MRIANPKSFVAGALAVMMFVMILFMGTRS
jgi:hypothetical protein